MYVSVCVCECERERVREERGERKQEVKVGNSFSI